MTHADRTQIRQTPRSLECVHLLVVMVARSEETFFRNEKVTKTNLLLRYRDEICDMDVKRKKTIIEALMRTNMHRTESEWCFYVGFYFFWQTIFFVAFCFVGEISKLFVESCQKGTLETNKWKRYQHIWRARPAY